MPIVRVLAREWKIEVKNSSSEFVEIGGINTFAFGGGKTDADTTGFDSEGWSEHLVAQRGRTLTIEGFFLEDPTDGTRDPGQAVIDELASKISSEARDLSHPRRKVSNSRRLSMRSCGYIKMNRWQHNVTTYAWLERLRTVQDFDDFAEDIGKIRSGEGKE